MMSEERALGRFKFRIDYWALRFPARVSGSRLSVRQSWNGPEQLFTWLDKMPLQPTERLQFVRGSNWSR
jgi:hypothetical protein